MERIGAPGAPVLGKWATPATTHHRSDHYAANGMLIL
jgi:hypothetical protein